MEGDGVSEELDFVCIVLPIGITYWPLLFPCGRTAAIGLLGAFRPSQMSLGAYLRKWGPGLALTMIIIYIYMLEVAILVERC